MQRLRGKHRAICLELPLYLCKHPAVKRNAQSHICASSCLVNTKSLAIHHHRCSANERSRPPRPLFVALCAPTRLDLLSTPERDAGPCMRPFSDAQAAPHLLLHSCIIHRRCPFACAKPQRTTKCNSFRRYPLTCAALQREDARYAACVTPSLVQTQPIP